MSFTDYDPKVGRYVYSELKSTDGFTKVPKTIQVLIDCLNY